MTIKIYKPAKTAMQSGIGKTKKYMNWYSMGEWACVVNKYLRCGEKLKAVAREFYFL